MNSKFVAAIAAIVILIAAVGAYAAISDKGDAEDHGSGFYDASGREVQVYGDIEKVAIAGTECVDIFAAAMGDGWDSYVCMMPADMDGSLEGSQSRDADKAEIIYEMYPALNDLPKCPDTYTYMSGGSFPVEQIITSGADMVMIPYANLSYFPDLIESTFKSFADAEITVLCVDFYNGDYTAEVAERNFDALGNIMGVTDRTDIIIQWYSDAIDDVMSVIDTIPESEKGKTVYYEVTTSDGSTYGRVVGMGTNDVTAVGAVNVLDGGVDMNWDDDKMMAANPEVIIIATTGYFGATQYFGYGQNPTQDQLDSMVSSFESRNIWDELSAVQNGAVEFRYGEFRNTPAGIYDLTATAKLVYPEYFEGVDPVSVVSEYYDLFMPWSFDGTWSYTLV